MNTGDCLSRPGATPAGRGSVHLGGSLFGLSAPSEAALLVAVVRARFRLILMALIAVKEADLLGGLGCHMLPHESRCRPSMISLALCFASPIVVPMPGFAPRS